MNLLQHGVDPAKTKTIVEYSSGSTVISMALVSRALYGIDDVHAFLSNKTTDAKIKLMRFFGLNVYVPSRHCPYHAEMPLVAPVRSLTMDYDTVLFLVGHPNPSQLTSEVESMLPTDGQQTKIPSRTQINMQTAW